jgi:transposase
VVADAAMLSLQNNGELKQRGLSYIVAARLANLPAATIDQISLCLSGVDGKTIRVPTKHGDLICSFTTTRYRKNLREMQKQIDRANYLVATGEPGRRAKFIAKEHGTFTLNQPLIQKTRKLLGVRGYYTNLPEKLINDKQIIDYYHDLWRVEQAFRMTKSDLAARPIFHHKEHAIKTHILICFLALAITKHIELATRATPRKTKDLLWQITEAEILDTTTGETHTLQTEKPPQTTTFLQTLGITY